MACLIVLSLGKIWLIGKLQKQLRAESNSGLLEEVSKTNLVKN